MEQMFGLAKWRIGAHSGGGSSAAGCTSWAPTTPRTAVGGPQAAIAGPLRRRLFPPGQIAILPGAQTSLPLHPQSPRWVSISTRSPPRESGSSVTNSKLPFVPTQLRELDLSIGSSGSGLIACGRRRGGHLFIVRPETVLRWHRRGWRLYWTWRSRRRIGRPGLPAEVKDLIAEISRATGSGALSAYAVSC